MRSCRDLQKWTDNPIIQRFTNVLLCGDVGEVEVMWLWSYSTPIAGPGTLEECPSDQGTPACSGLVCFKQVR